MCSPLGLVMRFWISKNSEVPIREQLTTQIMLGIASDELKANQKLPSTRELARRFGVHSNTVNGAYRALERRGWVKFHKGSGVYVRARQEDVPLDDRLELDHLISAFIKMARKRGFTLAELRSRVKVWLELQPPDHFLLIEPDAELRAILTAEIREVTGFRVSGMGLEECGNPAILVGTVATAMYGRAEEVRAALPLNISCILLRARSVQEEVRQIKSLPAEGMVAIVSCWPEFLRWARAILVAAGIDPAVISFRDAREKGWQSGLHLSTLVVCDVLVSQRLPAGCRVLTFRILAQASLSELKNYVEQFLASPPASKL